MTLKPLSLAVISAVLLVGCNDDNDTAKLRVTHASSDAPLVAVKLNGDVVDALAEVDYQQASPFLAVDSGTYDVAVDALLPADETLEVIAANLDLASDMQYDVFAVNNTASIEPVVLMRDDIFIGGNQVRVDVLHAHPDVSEVDIYLSTSDSITSEAPAISGLAFKVDSPDLPVTLPSDTYRIRVTLAGQKEVVFDSGELDLAGGSDLMITAVPNVDGGAVSPVNLLVADGDDMAVLRNTGEKATVRVVHAVKDAVEVDVQASGSTVAGFEAIAFKEFRSEDLPAGSYDLSVVANIDPSIVVFDAPGTEVESGTASSIYAVGSFVSASDFDIEPLLIEEDLRSVATYAKVRVVHASTAAGTVDVHASADGMFSEATVVLEDVEFKDNAVLNVPGGSYSLAVTPANSLEPLITGDASVEDGGVYSVVATDDLSGFVINVDTTPAE
ncbi:hypothetical protein JCM19237_1081 [Photobacterium aphoticum]|uniref:DUF4397 domain-containing protein n=1 Tax=Photobacterium aphoticum TaxID=754436 RepID=A0A090QRG4_9GAMM|nr:hypothetical protein JCM19237_1081 [Photobacterium aphoticum]